MRESGSSFETQARAQGMAGAINGAQTAAVALSAEAPGRRDYLAQSGRGGTCVLWIAHDKNDQQSIAALQQDVLGNYRIEVANPGSFEDLVDQLHEHRPRLIVADISWCDALGAAVVKQLQRNHPETDWLLRWDEPSPRWLHTLLHSGASGTVIGAADRFELERAFDAVIAGELWLPRRVLQWMYVSLTETLSAAATSDGNALPGLLDGELTCRESEVFTLMRNGLTNREIGERLGVSVNTVKKHVANVFRKQHIRTRRQTLG